MAIVYGSWITTSGSTKIRAYINYTVSSSNTTTTATISAGFDVVSGWHTKAKIPCTLSGTSQTSGSGSTDGSTTYQEGRHSLVKKTWSWARGKSPATKTITCKISNNGQTSSKSASVSVQAKPSYPVTKNVDGVTSTATKWYEETLSLGTVSKTGYTFKAWYSGANGTGTNYGTSYIANASATVYAYFTPNTYTITYNANGGTGTMNTQTINYGTSATLLSNGYSRGGYSFLGWSKSSTATEATYSNGASVLDVGTCTLYAVWQLTYRKPTIDRSRTNCVRCDDHGNVTPEGDHLQVQLAFAKNDMNDSARLAIQIDGNPTTNSPVAISEPTGTTGTQVINCTTSSGVVSKDSSHAITLTLTSGDWTNLSDVMTDVVTSVSFVIDVSADGNSIGFHQVARDNVDHKEVIVNGDLSLALDGVKITDTGSALTLSGTTTTTGYKMAQAVINAFSYADAKSILEV